MARPAKSVNVQSGEMRIDTAQERREIENKLKGDSAVEVKPAFELNERQTAIFDRIRRMFDKVGLLGVGGLSGIPSVPWGGAQKNQYFLCKLNIAVLSKIKPL